MASIVSAGTTSATALNMSADTTGILQLASNNGTVALTINTSQNIGIGTSSPAARLDVTTATAGFATILTNTNGASDSNGLYIKSGTVSTEYNLRLSNTSGSADFMVVKGNGFVGIGTSSPSALFEVSKDQDTATSIRVANSSAGSSAQTRLLLVSDGGNIQVKAVSTTNTTYGSADSGVINCDNMSGGMRFAHNDVVGMNLDTSAGLAVGNGGSFSGTVNSFYVQGGRIQLTKNDDWNMEIGGSQVQRIRFYSSAGGTGTTVGSITVSTTATTYATSSDYRLKHDVQPMVGALSRVAQLKPVTYKWNEDNSDGEGFIAHELAEVCPQAVNGEKDGVDKDGNILSQGIDTSHIVAMLTAAIQELSAKVTALENK
jgi:hypothetical protein